MKLKNKKAIGLFLSFAVVLFVAVPGTLAVEGDTDTATDSFLIDGEVTQDTDIPDVDILSDDEPETPAFTHKEGCSDECDGVDCDCSCHIEEPETPTEPETPAHIEGCSDECTNENCACSCHEMSLFDRLMACETYEELVEMVDAMTEEELLALTEEQIVQVDEKLQALEPEPLPEIILDENCNVISEALADDEPVDEEPFVSEIIYPTVNFDNVAPFGDPVIG